MLAGERQRTLDARRIEQDALGARDRDDLVHGGAEHVGGRRQRRGGAGAGVGDRRDGVVGGVPHELAPQQGGHVVREPVADAGLGEDRGQVAATRAFVAGHLAEEDRALGDVADDAGPGELGADLGHGAHERRQIQDGSEEALVLDAVLQRQHRRVLADDRRDQPRRRFRVVGLDRHEYETDRVEVGDRVDGRDARQMKVTVDALDGDAGSSERGEIRAAREEDDVVTGAGEVGAEEAADPARTRDQDAHGVRTSPAALASPTREPRSTSAR